MFLDKIGPFLGIIDLFLLQKKYAKILNLKLTLLDTFNNNQHLELTWGPILWQAPLIDLKDLPIFTIINHYSPTFQPMLAFYLGAHFVTSSFDRFERAADKRWGHKKKRLSRKNIQSGRKISVDLSKVFWRSISIYKICCNFFCVFSYSAIIIFACWLVREIVQVFVIARWQSSYQVFIWTLLLSYYSYIIIFIKYLYFWIYLSSIFVILSSVYLDTTPLLLLVLHHYICYISHYQLW